MNRAQYIRHIFEEYGEYQHRGESPHHGHPYETHHYSSSVPMDHEDSHADPVHKKQHTLAKFNAGVALGGVGTLAYGHHVLTKAHAAYQKHHDTP